MKKLYSLLIVFMIFGLVANAQVFQSNFDNWTSGTPDDWMGAKSSIEADSVIQITTGTTYGSNAAQLINTESSHKRFTTQQQNVTNGTSYEITFWAKGNGDVRTALFDQDWGSYNTYETINTTSWTEYSQVVTATADSDTAEFIISVRNTSGADHIILDRVEVNEATISTISIYDIQYTTDPGGDSPEVGNTVSTGGIVTAVDGGAYWVQSGVGPWTGVYVYDSSNTPSIGDSITFTASVSEYYNLTELSGVANYTVVSSGHTIAVTEIATGAMDESYEGVLLKFTAECVNASAGYGMWTINSGTGDLKVDDDMFPYTPTAGTWYNVTGVGHYSYDEYKVLPRDAADVEESANVNEVAKSNLSIFPNPTSDFLDVNSDVIFQTVIVYNIVGEVVVEEYINSRTWRLDVKDFEKGVYMVKINFLEGSGVTQKIVIE